MMLARAASPSGLAAASPEASLASGGAGSFGASLPPDVLSMREYLRDRPALESGREALNPLGIEVEDGSNRFEGQNVRGVEVLKVHPFSPAARAGLKSRRAAVNTLLETVTFVGALAFVPMGLAFQYVEDRGIGDQHDLIIGVDGERVRDVFELENALVSVKVGDVIYLSVLRGDDRLQIPICVRDGLGR